MELLREMRKFPGNAPGPSLKEIEELEDTFNKYIFYKREKTRTHVITTCCHKDTYIDSIPREETPELRAFRYAKNNSMIICPFCGKEVRAKAAGRVGRNVNEWTVATFITQRKGKLYALNIGAYREGLEKDISAYVRQVGEYTPGHVTTWTRSWYDDKFNEENFSKWIKKGQPEDSKESLTIGWKNIEKTPFRYIPQIKYTDTMSALFVVAFYPAQVEMLEKTGCDDFARDLIKNKRKNKIVFNWDAPTVKTAWKISKEEMRKAKARKEESGAGLRATLTAYVKLRKEELKTSTDFIFENLYDMATIQNRKPKGVNIPPSRIMRYVQKKSPEFKSNYLVINTWIDYITAMQKLGRDLEEERVVFPKDLKRAHDEAIEEQRLLEERIRAEEDEKRFRENIGKLVARSKKFNFRMGGMFIRVAMSPEEIRSEGKALAHCVGGYAERHIAGKTTILFMRKLEEPNTPLYTVEVDNNGRIVQAHGYHNEEDGELPPMEKYPQFFAAWELWYTRGSKRKKDGTPIVPKLKGVTA